MSQAGTAAVTDPTLESVRKYYSEESLRQAEEYKACVFDFLHWTLHYVQIQDRQTGQKSGRTIPFRLWPGQQQAAELILGSEYSLVLKARQLGLTWLVAAYCLWRSMFRFDELIIVVSANEDLAIEFLDRGKFIFDRLPVWMKPRVLKRTGTELTFGYEEKDAKGNVAIRGLNSTIKSIPSTPSAGQSKTITLFVMDESALNRYCKDIWAAAKPTLEHAGGQAIIISNPSKNMPGWSWTRDLYIGAMKGFNEFARVFLSWKEVPSRSANFLDLQRAAGLDDEDIERQYPSTEAEAISVSGGSYFGKALAKFKPRRGDIGRIVRQKVDAPELNLLAAAKKIDYSLLPRVFELDPKGILEVWVHPEPHWKNRYAIGSDVSEGLGESYSVAYVFDRLHHRFAARLRSNRVDADVWGLMLIDLAVYYNMAWICPERTGAGITTVNALQKANYPFLFFRQKPGKVEGKYVLEYGWPQTNENKQIVCGELKRYFRDVFPDVPCAFLITEASTFIRDDIGKLHAEGEKLDDCVLGAGITLQVSALMPPVKDVSPARRKGHHEKRLDDLEKMPGERMPTMGFYDKAHEEALRELGVDVWSVGVEEITGIDDGMLRETIRGK